MKKYSLISVIGLLTMVGCTASSNFFGNEMLPPGQDMVTSIDSTIKFKTYIVKQDSCVSITEESGGIIGANIDPYVGGSNIGFLCNFIPSKFAAANNDTLFGKGAHADSMFLNIRFSSGAGDDEKHKRIKISVYQIENFMLRKDSLYFSNFNPKPYYNASKPLVEVSTNGIDSLHIPLPKWFYSKFINEQDNTPSLTNSYTSYNYDTLFYKRFNGLYFKAERENGEGLLTVIDLNSSDMQLYYRNSTRPDSMVHKYYFYKGSGTPYGVVFMTASHDYTLSNQAVGGVNPARINDTTRAADVTYVQGFGGLATRAVLDMNSIEQFKAKALAKAEKEGKGTGYKNFAIHRAELRWYVKEKNVDLYNFSFPKLGLYWWTGKAIKYIPDYNLILDNQLGRESQFEGDLSRSRGFYVQNVTSLMQKLINGTETMNEFNLAPAVDKYTYPWRSIIGGSESTTDTKPIMIITYTLLK